MSVNGIQGLSTPRSASANGIKSWSEISQRCENLRKENANINKKGIEISKQFLTYSMKNNDNKNNSDLKQPENKVSSDDNSIREMLESVTKELKEVQESSTTDLAKFE